MEAIVDHDAAKFKQNMLSENDIKANMDWFDDMDEEIEQGVMTYSLLKDKASGAWLIALID
ncbi:hypothetical protein FHS19_005871 [Paenibacillus rhizosphaerae]|uniref:Uncharacterized protein n=1 Tax=Paenibacillus rhizosphaerae TaxID=297318 RepID=A0A839TXE0_9BACL|nr:hypothetical protein [Paenibacillus rhizosphaerae]MBB3131151.1 hypothetical protein [Paenibacillus rhizosphaerae]